MINLLYHPPVLFWVLLTLLVLAVIANAIKEILKPILDSFIKALAESAKNNAMLFILAFSMGMASCLDAFADSFASLSPKEFMEAGWWQIAALAGKSSKPMFAVVSALLVNPPAIKAAAATAVELAKKTATAAPFGVAPADPAAKP